MNIGQMEKIKNIVSSSSLLSASEKTEWLTLLPLMDDKQVLELEKILTSESHHPTLTLPLKGRELLQGTPATSSIKQVEPARPSWVQDAAAGLKASRENKIPSRKDAEPNAEGRGSRPSLVSPAKPVFSHILNLPGGNTARKDPGTSRPLGADSGTGRSAVNPTKTFSDKLKFMVQEKELPAPKKEVPELSSAKPKPAPATHFPPPIKLPPSSLAYKPAVFRSEPEAEEVEPVDAGPTLHFPTKTLLKSPPPVPAPKNKVTFEKPITMEAKSAITSPGPSSARRGIETAPGADNRVEDLIEKARRTQVSYSAPAQEPKATQPANDNAPKISLEQIKSVNWEQSKTNKPQAAASGLSFAKPDESFKLKLKASAAQIPKITAAAGSFKVDTLDDVKGLTPESFRVVQKGFVPKLQSLVKSNGLHQVLFNLEQSPLYKLYIDTGTKALADESGFEGLDTTAYLSRDEFEAFTDLLREVEAS